MPIVVSVTPAALKPRTYSRRTVAEFSVSGAALASSATTR